MIKNLNWAKYKIFIQLGFEKKYVDYYLSHPMSYSRAMQK